MSKSGYIIVDQTVVLTQMILYALLVLLHQSSNGLNELPTVNVDNTDIGVSGLSGGAFFAVGSF